MPMIGDIDGKEFDRYQASSRRRRSATPRRPSPPPPCSRRHPGSWAMTPKRTMAVAQQLYEGVDVAGEGTTGLITYMRTDSLRLSDEAMAAAAGFIRSRYGNELLLRHSTTCSRPRQAAQDAHEAIRPVPCGTGAGDGCVPV